MTDENKLGQDASRGMQAEALLENALLSEAFQKLEAAYVEAWRSTTIDDQTGREKLFLAINIVGKVKQHLQSVANDGKLAAAELRQLAQTAEREKRWQDIS